MNERLSTAPAAPRRLAFFLLKGVNRAVREFDMIQRGDRVAVAVSGGKDSLALLELLALGRESAAEPYDLAAIHVRGDASGITSVHPPLEAWLATRPGVPYRIVEPELGAGERLPLGCQRCTWLRRKALFQAAAEMGCNVVAYAHHADDAAQTTLLNLLYSSAAWTFAPARDYFGGRFRLIRPLFYVPESELRRLAQAMCFPPPPPDCSNSGHSRRQLVKDMLQLTGRDYPVHIRDNLLRAGLRGLSEP